MARSAKALINPELLVWGRECLQLDVINAAMLLKVDEQKLESWESGEAAPTVKQLRAIAKKYRQSIAAFYLPDPPPVFKPPLKDFRRLPGDECDHVSPDMAFDAREVLDRREITLELMKPRGDEGPRFVKRTNLRKNPEILGQEVRKLLDVTPAQQRSWRNTRLGFNAWREAVENRGVLVSQSSKIDTTEMRGYSIWKDPLPIIVVNRKDAYSARSFTLLHEIAHLMLRSTGICDLDERPGRSPDQERVEVFCNHVAAASLIPRELLLSEPEVSRNPGPDWLDSDLSDIARRYSASKEVLVGRLLTLGKTNQQFYRRKRRQYADEAAQAPTRKGFVHPVTDTLSLAGKPFVRLVVDALHSDQITTSDASDYLGLRLKHLDKVEQSL